jgi:hypothetical protein
LAGRTPLIVPAPAGLSAPQSGFAIKILIAIFTIRIPTDIVGIFCPRVRCRVKNGAKQLYRYMIAHKTKFGRLSFGVSKK